MSETLTEQLQRLLTLDISTPDITNRFRQRLSEGHLTRDEHSLTHFCVYFAAIDPKTKEIFIGHHKKSGLWLFNGGHIDKGETISEAVEREIDEEWGINFETTVISKPFLLTITPIDNPTRQRCRAHYDIWHAILVDKATFSPDQEKLSKEFYDTKWIATTEAKTYISDPNTHTALKIIEKTFYLP